MYTSTSFQNCRICNALLGTREKQYPDQDICDRCRKDICEAEGLNKNFFMKLKGKSVSDNLQLGDIK